MRPDDYAALKLPDQWIEDVMQEYEAKLILGALTDARKVLELGYGSGIVVKALAAAGKEVTLVDGAEVFASEAARMPGVSAVHSLFEEFEPVGRFDAVIASFVLEHVEDPVRLLARCRNWAGTLIAVVGNAGSYHRRLAVQMGIQPHLESLSPRDHAVGHFMVYDYATLCAHVRQAGWSVYGHAGLMLKPLPNSMMTSYDEKLIRAMCEIDVAPEVAANILLVCRA